MAAATLLTLIDDIATVLDDVAVLTKVAARKTGAVLGDDLALNAQQVSGVRAERELPVVWAVAKGSFRNKLILVPAALALSAVLPWAIVPLLMIGGAYLCFEGAEKLAHRLLHSPLEDAAHHAEHLQALADPHIDLVARERARINGAIRTDFILSAEIVIITLGAAAEADFATRVLVLSGIALLMTVGVYGLVAGIVKLDDAGIHLSQRDSVLAQRFGRSLLLVAPRLMKVLSVAGTAAMFLVGGGILVHGIAPLHHAIEGAVAALHGAGGFGAIGAAAVGMAANALVGIVAGVLVLGAVQLGAKLRGGTAAAG